MVSAGAFCFCVFFFSFVISLSIPLNFPCSTQPRCAVHLQLFFCTRSQRPPSSPFYEVALRLVRFTLSRFSTLSSVWLDSRIFM
jgi:hypothetical protein